MQNNKSLEFQSLAKEENNRLGKLILQKILVNRKPPISGVISTARLCRLPKQESSKSKDSTMIDFDPHLIQRLSIVSVFSN